MDRFCLRRTAGCLLLSFLLLMTGCASAGLETSRREEKITATPEKNITLVVLGDSIAAGQSLQKPEEQRYSRLVAQTVRESGVGCEEINYALNGLDSTDVLTALQGGEYPAVSRADVILLSVGANNLLRTAMDFFRGNLTSFLSVSQGTSLPDYTAFLNDVQAGIAQFEQDLPELLAKIREKTSAFLVLQTVYNPFADADLSLRVANGKTVRLCELCEEYVGRLNQILYKNLDSKTMAVADVYTAFAESGEDCVNTQSGRKLFGFPIDPHPNRNGHRIIAKLVENILREREIFS